MPRFSRTLALALGLYLLSALLIWLQARPADLFTDASEKLVKAWRARAARSYPPDLRVALRPSVITANWHGYHGRFPRVISQSSDSCCPAVTNNETQR